MQPQQQHYQQQPQLQQQPVMHDLLSAEASTPRLLSPEPAVNSNLPLFITVSEPVKKEAAGMLGMKGRQACSVAQRTLMHLLQVVLLLAVLRSRW